MTTLYLTNTAYGYPRGAERRVAPRRLACIHITANPRTPPATARQERDYANRDGSNGPSAHSYLNRDGTWVHAIDPVKYAAWSNGALRSPKTTVPGVAEVVASGKNPNEDYFREIETCGRYPDFPITVEQRAAIAEAIAQDSLTTGLPIGRSTVHLHSDLDSELRPNCPVPAGQGELFVADIIRAAREFRYQLEIEALRAQVDDLTKTLAVARKFGDVMTEQRDAALAQRDEAVAWGKRLQAFGGAILATDAPEWVE